MMYICEWCLPAGVAWEELANSGRPFGIESGGVTLAYFTEPDRELIRRLAPRARLFDDVYAGKNA